MSYVPVIFETQCSASVNLLAYLLCFVYALSQCLCNVLTVVLNGLLNILGYKCNSPVGHTSQVYRRHVTVIGS